jgi:hypothetical protein
MVPTAIASASNRRSEARTGKLLAYLVGPRIEEACVWRLKLNECLEKRELIWASPSQHNHSALRYSTRERSLKSAMWATFLPLLA